RSQLQPTYGTADLARIDGLVGFVPGTGCKPLSDPTNPNLRVIAPANGAITVNQYTGAGYFQITQDGTAIGAIISGGLSGGEPATPVPRAELVVNTAESVTPVISESTVATVPGVAQGDAGGLAGATPVSNEPINLVTGDYLLNPTDLTLGRQGMPFGLAL